MGAFDILLVEDNDSDAELAIRVLNKLKKNCRITHFSDGPSVLNYLLQGGNGSLNKMPGLILLDLKIPKINGLEVLKTLKDNDLTKAIPIVMLTSSQHHQDVKQAYQFGANSFIVKPLEFDAFSETISSVGNYWITINQL